MPSARLAQLAKYTVCDISDALLKLQVPQMGQRVSAGFLEGISPFPAMTSHDEIIAPASTVQFKPKYTRMTKLPSSNIETGKHWVDMTQPGTIVMIHQPKGQKCAVVGGILALRMSKLGAKAVVVSSRFRDMDELQTTGMPVWARYKSMVSGSAEAIPYAIQVPIRVDGVEVKPRDIIVIDPTNGVVVIPQELLDEVLRIIPTLEQNDAKVKEAVETGLSVAEAFAKFR